MNKREIDTNIMTEQQIATEKVRTLVLSKRMEFIGKSFQLVIMLIILGFAIYAFQASRAWFASSNSVKLKSMSASARSSTPSLFITQSLPTNEKLTSIDLGTENSKASLYPISTNDCNSWWYLSKWTLLNDKTARDDSFAEASITETLISSGVYQGKYITEEGIEQIAFQKFTFCLYTNNGEISTYLSPVDPIKVHGTLSSLYKSIRVALVTESNIIIYAPHPEPFDQYHYVSNDLGTLTPLTVYTDDNISNITAAATDKPEIFDKTINSISLGTATESGLMVSAYVWLEGTDNEATENLSGVDTSELQIEINLAGIEQQ